MNAPARRFAKASSRVRPSDPREAPRTIWLASATACLIGALEAFDVRGKWVAVPPNVCPNVIAAVSAVGARPWFVDVEPARQGMDPVCLSTVISEVAAVIAVHAYGVPCRIDEIKNIARDAMVPVIEDCAQSDGASFQGKEVGEFGDIAVFSFGAGKIVDAGGGGFATTTSRSWRARMLEVTKAWPDDGDRFAGEDLGHVYRHFYNRFYPNRTTYCQDAFSSLLFALAPGFRGKLALARVGFLLKARTDRDSRISERRRKHAAYASLFKRCPEIECIPLLDGAVPWRCNVLLAEDRRNRIFQAMLANGLKVSTWYPDITRFLPSGAYRSTELTIARAFDRRVLNLLLDDGVSDDDIRSTAKMLTESVA